MNQQRPDQGGVTPPAFPEVSAPDTQPPRYTEARPGSSGTNTALVVTIVLLVVVIVLGLIYFLVLDDSDSETASTDTASASTAVTSAVTSEVPAQTAAPTPAVALAPCVNGEISSFTDGRHDEIALYQQTLKDLGYDPGEVDGFYGPNTITAAQLEINANGNIDGPNGGFEEYFPDENAVLPTVFERLGIAC